MIIQEKISDDVMWLDKAYKLANMGYLPLTPKIGSILNKARRVRVFHITSPEKAVDLLKNIQGTKKSISTLTKVPKRTLRSLEGVWEDGALYYLEGDLLIKAKNDIMSKPDEQGRRWIDTSSADVELYKTYQDYKNSDKELNSLEKKLKKAIDNRKKESKILFQQYLIKYIDISTKFIEENTNYVLDRLKNGKQSSWHRGDGGMDWDELVVNNIKLIDVIYQLSDDSEVTPAEIKSTVSKKAIQIPNKIAAAKKKEMIRDFVDSRQTVK